MPALVGHTDVKSKVGDTLEDGTVKILGSVEVAHRCHDRGRFGDSLQREIFWTMSLDSVGKGIERNGRYDEVGC